MQKNNQFTGNIFIYHAFDIGDDINLNRVKQAEEILARPLTLPKYFKGYLTPLSIDLPHPHTSSKFSSCKLQSFGVISLTYKIPFEDSLENVRKELNELDSEFQEQSVTDAQSIFKIIKPYIKQPRFFHLRNSYVVIQVDQQSQKFSVQKLQETFGSTIASLVLFETETLSEYQKNEILDSAIGYYRGDLLVIEPDAAFVYDNQYEEILDLFEFANIQQLELQVFDRMLDQQLHTVYQHGSRKLPFKAYLPFIEAFAKDPIAALGMFKVEISVIIERLEGSIKVANEPYISEIYSRLVEKLDLKKWKESIDTKLKIIKDLNMVYQSRIDTTREEMLSVLIIILSNTATISPDL